VTILVSRAIGWEEPAATRPGGPFFVQATMVIPCSMLLQMLKNLYTPSENRASLSNMTCMTFSGFATDACWMP
jgi:hypothetical protein